MKNLTIRQQEVIQNLPATPSEVADILSITESTVRDHLASIEEAGYELVNREGLYIPVNSHPTNVTKAPAGSKGEKTRRANDHLFNLKTRINAILAESEPAVADGGLAFTPDNYDVVLHLTDLHIGKIVHDEYGEEIHNIKMATAYVWAVVDELKQFKARMEAAGTSFDTVHVLLGGDTVEGEGIFPNQPWETEETLDKQIDTAVELLYSVVSALSELFPSVQVVCQPGNHGEIRAKNMSEAFNADTIVYGFLDRLIRVSPFTNVTLIRNEATHYTNFLIRGGKWRGHIRHGENVLQHIGTTSPRAQWGQYLNKHKFDVAYRGHYHTFKLEDINGVPVIMGGSIAPPGNYEDGIGVYSQPCATYHLASDRQPVLSLSPIFFEPVATQTSEPVN